MAPFIFSFFLSEVAVGYSRLVVFFSSGVVVKFKQLSTNYCFTLACVLTTRVGLSFLFKTSRGFRSSWVRGVFLLHLGRLIHDLDSA